MRILVSGSVASVRALAPEHGGRLGLITTPANANGPRALAATGLPWAADNGCFVRCDPPAFRGLALASAGLPGLLWVVCPDRVADARATLALFDLWAPWLRSLGVPVAFVGQDGQESLPVPWERFACWFIGGSTSWKLGRESYRLAQEARWRGKHLHMGRVNSLRRLRTAFAWGCDSVDGSSYSRWEGRARKARPDMALERHLRFVAALEADARHPTLFGGAAGCTTTG